MAYIYLWVKKQMNTDMNFHIMALITLADPEIFVRGGLNLMFFRFSFS